MGSPGSTNVTQKPEIPPELRPLIESSVGWGIGLQNNLPISNFTGFNPRQVAGLSPMQQYALGQIPGLTQTEPGYTAAFNAMAEIPELTSRSIDTPTAELAQVMQLLNLTGGEIGSSPTTKAGMEAWKANVLPVVENEMVQAGLGRSGDLLKAVGQSASQAAFPLLQQEVENRMRSVGMLGDIAGEQSRRAEKPRDQTIEALTALVPQATALGTQMFNQRVTAIEQALRGGEITQETAQREMDAAREEFARLQALSEAATLGPLGQVLSSGALFGRNTSSQRDLYSAILGK